MPPRRALRPTPSNASDLSQFQKTLLDDLALLDQELLRARTSFYSFAAEYQKNFADKPDVVLSQLATIKAALHCIADDAAMHWAREVLSPASERVLGIRPTCIVQWRLGLDSMWRGPPDTVRVLRFARSIISSRFRKDSCIASRTLDMDAPPGDGPKVVTFRLCFGDGSARGVAASVVWSLILRRANAIPPKDPNVEDLIESLWAIPTNFELHGDGSERAALIAQAARQNQAAQTLPVNTLEWIGMVAKFANLTIGGPNAASKAALLRHLDQMMAAYNELPDVEAYVTEAPAKKLRRKSGARPTPKDAEPDDEGYDKGLRIGNRRILAMRNFLAGGTAAGFDLLREHLLWVGDIKLSVISDEVLMRKWFYVGSLPQRDDSVSQDVAALRPSDFVPKGAAFAPVHHNAPLSESQFAMMLRKAIKIFEGDTNHLERPDLKAKCKPKEDTWMQYRDIVQMWDLTVHDVAQKDLSESDFAMLQDAILTTRSLDAEVVALLARRPNTFHMGLLPTCCGDEKLADDTAKAVHQAHSEAAHGKLKVLEAELAADWASLQELHHGHHQLHELLRWIELEHRRSQAATAERLVTSFLSRSFPTLPVSQAKDLPSQLALMLRAWDSESSKGSHRRAVILLDFNTPHSRDSLRLPHLIAAVASTVKILGPNETVVLAWMPNAPKEGSIKTPEEDEADIVNFFRQEGLKTQIRVRMFFDMHASVANKTSEMDWWADGRILSSSDSIGENFWLKHSELARIRRVREAPTLPHTKDPASDMLRCTGCEVSRLVVRLWGCEALLR